MATWTTPADIRTEVERLWSRGLLLGCILQQVAEQTAVSSSGPTVEGSIPPASPIAFPYQLRLRAPLAAELGAKFEAVRDWIRSLDAASKGTTGAGFEIHWRDVNTRALGRNRLPSDLILTSLDDALALVERRAEANRFAELARATLARFPMLCGWIARKPLTLLEQYADWARILEVLVWFAAHPKSGLYVRQIDVPGVDTKFIEGRKALLGELLDIVLPEEAIERSASGTHQFETRYGLTAKPVLIRFRLLDPELAIAGLTDMSVPIREFANAVMDVRRVFIVENEVTALAFPQVRESIVIFGGGYAVERLAAARWLCSRDVIYWGDIDTHGFVILDRLRALIPQTGSLLMDRETLLAHRALWTFESTPQHADLHHLNCIERATYDDIRLDRFKLGVRLEQERIPYGYLCSTLSRYQ
jgi:hypothetical protein